LGVFRQFRRYGRGKAKVIIRHPDSVRLRHFAAPGLVAGWTIASLLGRRHRSLVALATIPYACALAAGTAIAGKGKQPSVKARLPVVFVIVHVAWGLGFWEGVLREFRVP